MESYRKDFTLVAMSEENDEGKKTILLIFRKKLNQNRKKFHLGSLQV
ncbi:hypothetical protein LEP1GSC067_0689 [Leptospira interrogans serovar Lora str. TE 1992]|uniref:Uncharacterized protein n=5 Tax=Leptospira interrogans TaxID=173 RepID=A0A829D8L8_LEPIR|nr:hypothetical protein LEP1GSC067_0689 [Leptospira interrogans serovar Lora str. TE 1992]EMG20036.1 hypothetical protein LEP1GSC150_3254 [Leptospira interrogans serovar Copenhageni str. LT2050]EMM84309.1 hypothetical protein LEP1GSC037_3999 [Leptospira interrogans str. 2006001854]EMM95312.1 hypothetical protein LEP1GSC158_0992 [Leptospira interrogans serovar Zanoni str. LT2156]EMY05139.1 hypothetical protein LEP1GSC029_4161 [Leptospira interrogans str. 2002000626]